MDVCAGFHLPDIVISLLRARRAWPRTFEARNLLRTRFALLLGKQESIDSENCTSVWRRMRWEGPRRTQYLSSKIAADLKTY